MSKKWAINSENQRLVSASIMRTEYTSYINIARIFRTLFMCSRGLSMDLYVHIYVVVDFLCRRFYKGAKCQTL